MIKVLNFMVCLFAAAYMYAEFQQGAGCSNVEITSKFFQDVLANNYDRMKGAYHFVLYILAFESLVLVLGSVYRRFLKDRFRFAETVCTAAMWTRLAVDAAFIALMLMFSVFDLLATHGLKSFEFVDGRGNSTVIVSERKILQ